MGKTIPRKSPPAKSLVSGQGEKKESENWVRRAIQSFIPAFFFLLLFSVERRERGRRKRRSRESRLDLIGYARYVFPPLHIRTRARHEWDDLLSTVFFEIRTNASLFSSYRSSVLLFVFANINMSVNTLWPTTFDGCVQPNKPVFSVTNLFELKSFRLSQCLVIDSSKFRDHWLDLNSHGPFNNFPNNNQKE